LKAQIDGLDGVPFAAWERSVFDLRQNNRNAASLTQDVVDRAIKRIKKIDAEQCAFRQLGPIGDTYDQIKRAQKETFWGLTLGGHHQISASPSIDGSEDVQGLLSNEIKYDPSAQPQDLPILREEQDRPVEFWSFSDEDDIGDTNDNVKNSNKEENND
jgi:putative transposase